ncbi:MAG: fused MFS/spermidine synthase [Rhodospirillaceae bacterium]|jgi:spermidine synthase|nr:fused MFS/spermidine synthase [Rhodospirillaceae bacterium]MBT4748429.1 fused MFS/spermidine synthase [Rhodospirillaceae bacterium]MBT5178020.1 fused MFS/spermidine synthase [Rhodospirillaceae bacterium]MBT5841228.1 fused MFS/spermidine synthase [Rhodospirillaceae bacterium]MBT6861301.1 fused MFS/spermidine synthase [Rhodospirillaceae bacterium]
MRKYEYLIFATGAVTLALEVLASRIMTPYFGVSLYIWTGILSITLTFLALGYHLGGVISRRAQPATLEGLFLASPVLSAISIAIAAAIYPVLFPALSQFNLIAGSFIGATLILALPLIALSAMNPLLIGMQRTEAGDAGAGRVFFISTVGSVAGVLLTAFLFIPNMTNFRAVLTLGLVLCVLVAVYSLAAPASLKVQKRNLILGSLVVGLVCAGLLVAKDSYLKTVASGGDQDLIFNVRAEYTSVFGNVKVVDVRSRRGLGEPQRLFVQDGIIQNRTSLNHQSLSLYTYMLEALAKAFVPNSKRALILGLGAGAVVKRMRDAGTDVTVVDINTDILTAALDHFGFDGTGVQVEIQDARTFVRACKNNYDVVIVDLFLGDNVPDYLLTRQFFTDVRRCANPNGAMVMNAFFDDTDAEPNQRLLATIRAAFPSVFVFGDVAENIFLAATQRVRPRHFPNAVINSMPNPVQSRVRALLRTGKQMSAREIAKVEPVSDEHNIFSVLFAPSNMRERKVMAGRLPPWVLVN